MKYCLYLDDIRDPKTDKNWFVVRDMEEFKDCLLLNGSPEEMSLDHDLGEDQPSGLDCLKWFFEKVMDGELKMCDDINVHSANPVGATNMISYIKSFKKVKRSLL